MNQGKVHSLDCKIEFHLQDLYIRWTHAYQFI